MALRWESGIRSKLSNCRPRRQWNGCQGTVFIDLACHPSPAHRREPIMSQFRTERDTFGNIEVPAERLWGAQTQRSLQNFRISGERMPIALIHALATVKRAAAQVNRDLKVLDTTKADAIIKAADEVIAGKHDE